jgi:hypothetical protein
MPPLRVGGRLFLEHALNDSNRPPPAQKRPPIHSRRSHAALHSRRSHAPLPTPHYVRNRYHSRPNSCSNAIIHITAKESAS